MGCPLIEHIIMIWCTKILIEFVWYKNKGVHFPWTDLAKGYHCDQIVAHCALLRSGHRTKGMYTHRARHLAASSVSELLAIGQYLWNP